MKMMAIKKGQSLVEFAIVFVVLIYLLSAVFDLSRAMVDYAILNTAVREGTRYAVVNPNGDICGKVQSYLFNAMVLNCTNNIIISKPPPIGSDGQKIRIQISYNYTPLTPGWQLLLGTAKNLTINVQSEMFLTPNAK
jgi:hypothetical protein